MRREDDWIVGDENLMYCASTNFGFCNHQTNGIFQGNFSMKKLVLLFLFFCTTSVSFGEVSVRVCQADGNTPFEYRDIMVGTKLTLIISSDVVAPWDGALFIADANRDYGVLSARDYNETTLDWAGSRFEAAGENARVWDWTNEEITGFEFYYGGTAGATAGDWYIIDYNAIKIGNCDVGFYDYSVSWDIPIYNITFSHVRTRDFPPPDGKVDFGDFNILAKHWQRNDCNALGDDKWCNGTDLDLNGSVDANDLMLFSDFWLEKTR